MPDRWVWFDFENTPHVLFLEPLIRRLGVLGWDVRITAKAQAQTLELAATRGLEVSVIGSGGLVGWGEKVGGGVMRSARLVHWAKRGGTPRLLVSSSRTAALAAWVLRVPAVGLLDYEHAEHRTLALGNCSLWFPDLLRGVMLPRATARVARFYAGLKENLYLDSWDLDRVAERRRLGLSDGEFLVIARPPAATAHYASEASGRLWLEAVRGLLARPQVRVIAVPRTAEQRSELERSLAGDLRVRVLREAVQGPSLVAGADLVVGGGGTMNREAAVLGVPAWSAFTGPTPEIDNCLAGEERLRWVRSRAELEAALSDPAPVRRPRRGPYPAGLAAILKDIEVRLGVPGA